MTNNTIMLSSIHPAFYDWTHFGGMPTVLGDNPELLKNLPIANPQLIRQMSYHISSLGGRVAQIAPNTVEWGSLLGPEMIALIITALVKLSNASGGNNVFGQTAKVLCGTKAYQEVLYGGNVNDFNSAAEVALNILISQINDPNQTDVLFPGGWDGHAIMYGIHKDLKTNAYTFRIWNTGDGLEYHTQHPFFEKFAVRIEWDSLSLEQISHPEFLKELFKFQIKENAKNELYKFINEHFNQKQLSDRSYQKYRNDQEYNNCEWKCTWAAVADLLRRDLLPIPVLETKKEVITILREELLEKIHLESTDNIIDPILINSAKHIENMLDSRIFCERTLIEKFDSLNEPQIELLRHNKGKTFSLLRTIPDFSLEAYALFPPDLQEMCLKNPTNPFQDVSPDVIKIINKVAQIKSGKQFN